MAAFDFPPTPAVGTLYPLVAEVGKPQYRWNGSEWVAATLDPAGYVRKSGDAMTGALSLAGDPTQALHAVPKQYIDAQRQRFALAGLTQLDVVVPTWAVGAKVVAAILPSTAAVMQPFMRYSVTPGVFAAGASDYAVNGFQYLGTTATISQLGGNFPYIYISGGLQNAAIHYMFTGQLVLKKPASAGVYFEACFDACGYTPSVGFVRSFSYIYMPQSTAATSVLAFRLFELSGVPWAAESYLNVEWF